jgi:transcription antitermination factor NusG
LNIGLGWFAIRVKSNRENVTVSSLKGKGYDVCLPTYKKAARPRSVESPVFPGYVFCYFDVNRRLPILTVPGVVGIVGRGKVPEPVQDEEMQYIRTLAASDVPRKPSVYIAEGDHIRVTGGPLAGVEGVLLREKDSDYLVISVTLLQRSLKVEMEREWISLVETRPGVLR